MGVRHFHSGVKTKNVLAQFGADTFEPLFGNLPKERVVSFVRERIFAGAYRLSGVEIAICDSETLLRDVAERLVVLPDRSVKAIFKHLFGLRSGDVDTSYPILFQS